jgi:phosphoglycolate phosphatase
MLKAVVFDLDGTLLDTLEDIAISCNFVLEYFEKSPLPIEDYNLIVGQGAKQLFIDLLPDLSEDEQAKALGIFEKHYATQFNKNTKIYDNISKVLSYLQVKGIKMAVLSNKPNAFTKKCVLKYLKDWKFDAVYGIRDGIKRKPDKAGVLEILEELHVKPNETIFIGDTKVDMLTAKNSNMDSIGVLWGFREEKELVEHGATYIAKTPSDIIKIVGTL